MTIETFDQWIDLVGNGDIKEIENEISNNKNILNLRDNDGNSPLLYSLKLQKIFLDKKNGKQMTFDDKLKHYITYMDLEKVKEFINSGGSFYATYENDPSLTLLKYAENVYNEGKRENDDNIYYDYSTYFDDYTGEWRPYNFNDSVIKYLESDDAKHTFDKIESSLKLNKKIIELLIDKGADLNLQDNNKDTALLYSLKNGYKDMAELLINKGADLNLQDNDGNSPLLYSLKLQKIPLDKKNGKKMTFDDKLKFYITYMDLEKVKEFINSGGSVNATYENDPSLTLLQHAKNVYNEGKRVIENDDNIEDHRYQDKYRGQRKYSTYLDNYTRKWKVYDFNDSVINYLEISGSASFKFNINNLTFEDNQKIIELLINKGADLNIQDNNKDTALFHAVRNSNDNIDIVKLLIEKGADKDYVKTYWDYNESIDRKYRDTETNNYHLDVRKTSYTYRINILRIAKDLNLEKMISYLKSLNIKELSHSKQVCIETWHDCSSHPTTGCTSRLIERTCNPIEYF